MQTMPATIATRRRLPRGVGLDTASVRSRARWPIKTLLPFVGALFAVNLLLPQVGQAQATVDALAKADWMWIAPMAAAGAWTYLASAIALAGAARGRVRVVRTWAVQVASAFTNRLAPAGIGGMTTNVRYLVAAGISRPDAVATVGLNSIAGFVVHLVGLLAVVPLLGAGHVQPHLSGPDFPDRWLLLLAIISVFVAAGVVRWGASGRDRLGPVRDAIRSIASTARCPRAAVRLVVGAAGITAGYAAAFYFATRAFGLVLPVATVAAVYLGGSAVAAAAPTPGGLGAVEAALVAGLTVTGAPSGPAIAAVLTYRLVTFWAPVIPGAVAYRMLRRAGTL